jgi:hypothetical protein
VRLVLPIAKVAERVRQSIPQMEGKKRLLAMSAPTQVNPVSVLLVCALARSSSGPVLFLSVDRPNETLARMINKHCANGPSILFPNKYQDPPKAREVSCASSLFAPKLLVEAVSLLSAQGSSGATVVMGNLSTLAFYNSNDRIKEFMAKLGEFSCSGSIGRLVIVMDRNAQYLYALAREFCELEIDLSE